MSDHYHTLGVSRFASKTQVRDAYVRLMKRHHAALGRSGLSEDRLREIGIAYWELRHPERRAVYDARLREEHRRHDRAVWRILHGVQRPALFQRVRVHHADRWLFFVMLPLLLMGVVWATRRQVPAPTVGMLEETSVVAPGAAASDARLLKQLEGDYALMATLNEQKRINSDIDRCLEALRADDLANARRTCPSIGDLDWGGDRLERRFRSAVSGPAASP